MLSRRILRPPEPETRKCSCPSDKKSECPLNNQCLSESIIYQATVKEPTSISPSKTYIGLCSTDFKQRLGVHRQTFKDPTVSQTLLSKHVREIKSRGVEPAISWKLIDKGKTYSPVSAVCQLCTREAYCIAFCPDLALLNAKSDF